MHVAEAAKGHVQRRQADDDVHASARTLGRLDGHRADHAGHARIVDPGIGADTVHHVRAGTIRGGNVEAVSRTSGSSCCRSGWKHELRFVAWQELY